MGNVKGHNLKIDYVNTDKLVEYHTNIQQYFVTYNLGDFTNDDMVPNLRVVNALISSASAPVYKTNASTSDTNPKVISAATLLTNGITSLRPKVIATIPLATSPTDTDTTEGTATRVDYLFTDNTKTILSEIHVWGNDNGAGNFNEDTIFSITN